MWLYGLQKMSPRLLEKTTIVCLSAIVLPAVESYQVGVFTVVDALPSCMLVTSFYTGQSAIKSAVQDFDQSAGSFL